MREPLRSEEHGLQVELRLQALVDAIPDLVFRITADGTYLDFAGDADLLANPWENVVGGSLRRPARPEGDRPRAERLADLDRPLEESQPQRAPFGLVREERRLVLAPRIEEESRPRPDRHLEAVELPAPRRELRRARAERVEVVDVEREADPLVAALSQDRSGVVDSVWGTNLVEFS